MGLNPPFGVKAALANKFIDKALEFNPKLLILIVPPETERYYVPSLSLSLSLSLKHSQLFPLTRLDKKNFLERNYLGLFDTLRACHSLCSGLQNWWLTVSQHPLCLQVQHGQFCHIHL